MTFFNDFVKCLEATCEEYDLETEYNINATKPDPDDTLDYCTYFVTEYD